MRWKDVPETETVPGIGGEAGADGGPSRALLMLVLCTRIFKRMFKKKVKKKDEEEEEEEEEKRERPLTREELEEWARLQQILKKEEGRGKVRSIDREEEEGTGSIKQGYNYLFEEIDPNRTYATFFELTAQGKPGLCITHTYPGKIRDTYEADFETIPIFWLSDWYGASKEFLTIGMEERTIRPTRLDFEIMKEISNFIKKEAGEGIMILDGIEALVLANSFEKVISFLTNVNNMASANKCTVLAPINPHVFKKRDRYILQKIFDEVRTYVDDIEDAEE